MMTDKFLRRACFVSIVAGSHAAAFGSLQSPPASLAATMRWGCRGSPVPACDRSCCMLHRRSTVVLQETAIYLAAARVLKP
jgi:hypothetical protein